MPPARPDRQAQPEPKERRALLARRVQPGLREQRAPLAPLARQGLPDLRDLPGLPDPPGLLLAMLLSVVRTCSWRTYLAPRIMAEPRWPPFQQGR